MFKKIFEYAGPYKKNMYVATVVVLVSVLMGVLPFVLAYQVISPLVMGDSVETEFVLLRVIGVLICLVLQAFFYGWGLSISHKAAYNTLFRLRVSLQKKFEKLPLGIVEEKGTGTIKKLFVDDVDSLELLLAHSVPEGIANLLIPLVIYVAMFCADWKLALMSLASIPISLLSMVIMYSVGMKRMGPYYQSAQNYLAAEKEGKKADSSDYSQYMSRIVSMSRMIENPADFVTPAFYETTESMAIRWASLEKIEMQTVLKIIVGEESIDAFDKFVSDWNNAGGEMITEEVNEAIQK